MEALLPWLLPQPPEFRELCRSVDGESGNRGNALRRLASFALDGNSLHRLAKSITSANEEGVAGPLSSLTLGIVSNGTTDYISSSLIASSARHGVALKVVTAPFGVTAQAAFDTDGDLLKAKPEAILLALDYRVFFGERILIDCADERVDDAISQLSAIVKSFSTALSANIIVQTLAAPNERIFGSFDRLQQGTLASLISKFNARLCTEIVNPGVYIVDVEALANSVGLDQWFDLRQWTTARLPFSQRFLPIYSEFVARVLGAMRGTARKVLVLDLDNTLWGGVIGDDGIGGLRLGNGDPLGEAFLDFQHAILALKKRGVILAVSSKNDEDLARSGLRDHPEMILHEADFAALQINWNDKASNLEAIAKRLELGLESFVFFDDNPAERAQIRMSLPQVAVPEIPNDPSAYARILLTAGYFEGIAFSEEDRSRASQYAENANRSALLTTSRDLESFLTSLDMRASFTSSGPTGWQRFTQLINKSNQFNLTTYRYTESEILAMTADPAMLLLQVKLRDRFGDNGMISSVICRHDNHTWDIDTWVMSCRVLNRQVETAVLNEIAERAIAVGVTHLVGTYRPTDRNGMVRDHYQKLGFQPIEIVDGLSRWVLDLTQFQALPVPIQKEG